MGPVVFQCLFLAILLAKEMSAKKCTALSKAPPCPSGYVVTPEPATCINHRNDVRPLQTYAEAKAFCSGLGSNHTLFVSHNSAQTRFLTKYLKGRSNQVSWIGLDDIKQDGSWVWVNNLPLPANGWRGSPPKGGAQHNCAQITDQLSWLDSACDSPSMPICQTEHKDGPRQLEMRITWHRGPGTMYRNHNATVTCSAFSPVGKTIGWTYRQGGTAVNIMPASLTITEREEMEVTSLGYCGQKYISEIQFMAKGRELDGLELSCFSRDNLPSERCPTDAGPLSFCRSTGKPMAFMDGPVNSPKLTQAYVLEDTIELNCSISTWETGHNLVWVAYFRSGPVAIPDNDTRIVFSSLDRRLGNPYWTTDSTLHIKWTSKLEGITVACFSHNLTHLKLSLDCPRSNPFCAMSEPFEERPKEPHEEKGSWTFILGFMAILLTVAIVLAALGENTENTGATEAEAENAPEDDPDLPAKRGSNQSSKSKRGSNQSSKSKTKSKSMSTYIKSGTDEITNDRSESV